MQNDEGIYPHRRHETMCSFKNRNCIFDILTIIVTILLCYLQQETTRFPEYHVWLDSHNTENILTYVFFFSNLSHVVTTSANNQHQQKQCHQGCWQHPFSHDHQVLCCVKKPNVTSMSCMKRRKWQYCGKSNHSIGKTQ